MKMYKVVMPNGKEYGLYSSEGSAKSTASRLWKDNRENKRYRDKYRYQEPVDTGHQNPVVIEYELTETNSYEWPGESFAAIQQEKLAKKKENDERKLQDQYERELASLQRKYGKMS